VSTIPFTPAAVADALAEGADRFADQIAEIADPMASSKHAPGWSIDEIVRHVTMAGSYYLAIDDVEVELVSRAGDLGAMSDGRIGMSRQFDLAECAAKIRTDFRTFADRVRSSSPEDPPKAFHAGSKANTFQMGCVLVGETEVHGYDVAAAMGRRWTIPKPGAAMTVLGSSQTAAPQWVDPLTAAGHTANYDVRLRGDMGRLRFEFEDGALTVNPEGPWRPDTTISADPTALLLVLYRRTSQWSAMAKGQMMAWGRKPWLAFGLTGKFLPI
jgi:uncharacterized protein (TIGR03083 family)